MRKLIAWVFMYSLDGLLADEGTDYWQNCFGLPIDPEDQKQKLGLYESAYAHIMGRTAYEGMAGALPTADHPYSGIMNAARKVVFSRTLHTAEWANTPRSPLVMRHRRPASSGEAATATSWSGAALACGGRPCGST
jgi:dihydrofolate reductase